MAIEAVSASMSNFDQTCWAPNLYDLSRKNSPVTKVLTMRLDPMMTTLACCEGNCDHVSEKIVDAVLASLKRIPTDGLQVQGRYARSLDLAQCMAEEGWRFCRCFPMLRTEMHARIFELVHTDIANMLAQRKSDAMSASSAQAGDQIAA